MTGIVQSNGHKLLSVNGVADHVHILIGLRPTQGLSELVQQIKRSSSKWINDNKKVRGRFAWQEGFGAFSCNMEGLDYIIRYIENQEAHHQRKSFKEEYIQILNECGVEFDERYLFNQL